MKFAQYKQQAQKGFTLIELMIVVAIIGILAAVAIPAYNDYIQRAQASEAFSEVGGMQTAISAFAQENGTYPTDDDIAAGIGAPVTGKYSAAATGAAGVITVTMNDKSGADVTLKKITFTPPAVIAGATSFPFACASATILQKYLPKTCVGQ